MPLPTYRYNPLLHQELAILIASMSTASTLLRCLMHIHVMAWWEQFTTVRNFECRPQ
jgi:hypothetical protein